MRFAYEGPEIAVSIFGATFPKGVAVEVSDGYAIGKLSHHPEFISDNAPAEDKPRRGRPPKAVEVVENADQG